MIALLLDKIEFQQQGDHQLAIDLQIPAKGITAIFGVSGAGKTSLRQTADDRATESGHAVAASVH
jgi:ABC-type molybdate transport system ATPase subunit